MKSFKLRIFNGHPVITDENLIILIDTGAPLTTHTSDKVTFCSTNYNCATSYLRLTIPKISEMLGMEITTLMGTDILSGYQIMFDYKNEVVEFSEQDIPLNGNEIEIASYMGIPIIELLIGNEKMKFFLDTGAKLSYLSNDITAAYQSSGTEEDFYPLVGKFQTKIYNILTSFENHDFNVVYGNLPLLLQMALLLGGTSGVIGYDFFSQFKVVLDLKNRRLKYALQMPENGLNG